MSDDEFEQFAEMWSDCWSFYGRSVTPGTLNLAFQVLQRYELTDISAALTRHLNDPDAGQYYPKPADVVRNIDGAKASRGLLAWSSVNKAIRTVGPHESVVFDDPIIQAVISDMGGWVDLNKVTEDEMPFRAREFEKRYQGYILRPPAAYPRRLVGIAEAKNGEASRDIAPPVLVGDRGSAAMVYQRGGDSSGPSVTRLSGPVNKAMAALVDSKTRGSA